MVGKWVKVIAAIVIVSILIFIMYFAYDGINARWHETVTKIQWAKTSLKMHAFWLNINRLVI